MSAPLSRSGADAGREKEEGERKRGVVRTMRSDIAEFLKTTKPSLLELGVRSSEPGMRRSARIILALKILGLAIILGVFAGGGFLAYRTLILPPPPAPTAPPPPPPPPPPPAAPQSLMFFESDGEVTILRARHELEQALAADRYAGAAGEFHRIIIRVPDEADIRQILGAREFFALLAASPPEDFLTLVAEPPQFFAYSSAEFGPALGMLFAVRDPAGALGALGAWEPRLSQELSPLLAARPTTTAPSSFAGAVYRNIPYRFRKLDPERDRGIGYSAFPASNLVLLAASEETLKRTIDRIFEGR